MSTHSVLPVHYCICLSCNLCAGQRKCCVTTHCTLTCMAITERQSSHRPSTTGGGKRTECSTSWRLHATTQVCLFNQLEVTHNHTGMSAQPPGGYTQPYRYVYSTTWSLLAATQLCLFNQQEVTRNHAGMSVQPAGGYTQPHRYVCSTIWSLHATTQVCLFNHLEVTCNHTGISVQPPEGNMQPCRYVCSTTWR